MGERRKTRLKMSLSNLMEFEKEDASPRVRWPAASHPNATPEVLMKAMADASPRVRWAAARQSQCHS